MPRGGLFGSGGGYLPNEQGVGYRRHRDARGEDGDPARASRVVQAFMLPIVLVALHEPRPSQGREKEIEREPSREPSGCQSLVSETTTRTRTLLMPAASGTDA